MQPVRPLMSLAVGENRPPHISIKTPSEVTQQLLLTFWDRLIAVSKRNPTPGRAI